VSRKREDFTVNALERLAKAKLAGELERQEKELDKSIIDLSGDLKRAQAKRTDRQEAARAFAAQAMKTFKQEQAARTLAAQAMEKFKAEQARKVEEQRQESKLTPVAKESKQERGR
jgi:hypothetical protein